MEARKAIGEAQLPLFEEWKHIPGAREDHYVSTWGRFRSNRGVSATWSRKSPIYKVVAAGTLHIIVARTFLGPQPPNTIVNHINGDASFAAPCNLEYISSLGNSSHCMILSTSYTTTNYHLQTYKKELVKAKRACTLLRRGVKDND